MRSKEEGVEIWKACVTQKFLDGGDKEFDYSLVDNNEAYDDPVPAETEKNQTTDDEGDDGIHTRETRAQDAEV